MRGSVRAWLPATTVAVLLAIGIVAAAYLTLGRGSATARPSPSATVDIHSKEAVVAAVKHYYQAEDKAGETGNVELVRSVTTGPGTPAYENLKEFFREQTAQNRHSVTVADHFGDWQVNIGGDRATVSYSIVQVGHDTDASTGKPIEVDMKTTKAIYRATLKLTTNRWLLYERDLVREEPS